MSLGSVEIIQTFSKERKGCAAVTRVLRAVDGVRDPVSAAAAVWRRLTAPGVHWAEVIGCFRKSRVTRGIADAQEARVTVRNRHVQALRRALVMVSEAMWRRRDQELQLLV